MRKENEQLKYEMLDSDDGLLRAKKQTEEAEAKYLNESMRVL